MSLLRAVGEHPASSVGARTLATQLLAELLAAQKAPNLAPGVQAQATTTPVAVLAAL